MPNRPAFREQKIGSKNADRTNTLGADVAQVPFFDIRSSYLELKSQIDSAVARVLDSGWYIMGPEVESFEAAYASYCNAKHCVGVSNGLDALILSLRALEIGHGDDVIVPSNTFIATWLAVTAVGANPIPVEPDPQTYNIDPKRIAEAVSPNTKAIIAVHLYGQPADLSPIQNFANENGLKLIEDAAQSQGATYRGVRIGAHADAVCWSFYPAKNLGAMGDAGAITTNSREIAERVALLRNYGSREKYLNEEPGSNCRLDPIQAAVLAVKLEHLDRWTEARRTVAKHYISDLEAVQVPFVPDWANPVWHLFVVQHPKRDLLISRLQEEGIGTMIHYPIPPHLQKAFSSREFGPGDFPIAERLARTSFSLPMGPHLLMDAQNRVIETVNRLAATL